MKESLSNKLFSFIQWNIFSQWLGSKVRICSKTSRTFIWWRYETGVRENINNDQYLQQAAVPINVQMYSKKQLQIFADQDDVLYFKATSGVIITPRDVLCCKL